jgi:hypothetical protein
LDLGRGPSGHQATLVDDRCAFGNRKHTKGWGKVSERFAETADATICAQSPIDRW